MTTGEMNMNKKTKKYVLTALAAATALVVLPAVMAFASPGDAKEMSEGYWTEKHRWIEFGRYNGVPLIWRILEVGRTNEGSYAALLLAENAVAEGMNFDAYSNGWAGSYVAYIEKWLNNDFYAIAFNEKEQGAVMTCEYYSYGGNIAGSDKKTAYKIFLLSEDDVMDSKNFANDNDRSIGLPWWLRSPGVDYRGGPLVYGVGRVFGIGINASLEKYAIRPALKINLASEIFTSPSSKYEILYSIR
jgi:hypothetical protein